ncbi:MAG: hypothetical protein J6C85_01765 [Alphaproteobacteria bacterium]|nr:hypothetical protein [Alphaproteobacteria bacterium]
MNQKTDKWGDLYDTMKNAAKEAVTQVEAFCGVESAKRTLKKREEDKVISQYFGDKVFKNLPEASLRGYARKIIQYQNDDYVKNPENYSIKSLTQNVRSQASKRQFDKDHHIEASLKKAGLTSKEINDYHRIQEYASFGMDASIASMGKPLLEKIDKALEESMSTQTVAEFRKQYRGKSFSEIHDKCYDPELTHKQQKILDSYQSNVVLGSYR